MDCCSRTMALRGFWGVGIYERCDAVKGSEGKRRKVLLRKKVGSAGLLSCVFFLVE